MTALLRTAAQGFPSFAGIVWGGLLVATGTIPFWPPLVLLLGLLVGTSGERLIGSHPRVGLLLIDISVSATAAIVALSTWTVLFASTHLQSQLHVSTDEAKAITSALVGALTTYLALLWTKEIADGKGPLWPSTRFRSALKGAYSRGSHVPDRTTQGDVFSAVFDDRVPSRRINGWGWRDRWKRAQIVAAFLQ